MMKVLLLMCGVEGGESQGEEWPPLYTLAVRLHSHSVSAQTKAVSIATAEVISSEHLETKPFWVSLLLVSQSLLLC